MPMPDRRRSVIDALQQGPDCRQCRVTGEVDLQGSHRDVSLGNGVEVGAGTRVLLRPGGTDPVHRTPARVLRAHDRLGTVAKAEPAGAKAPQPCERQDRKSTRLNSSHSQISYAVFCLKKKKTQSNRSWIMTRRWSSAR